MKILINTIAHAGGGGITYLENMLPRFAEDEDEYIVLVPKSREILEEPKSDSIRFEKVDPRFDPLPARMVYEQLVLPIKLRRWNIDVMFSPADLTPLLTSRPTLLAVRNPNPYFSATDLDLDRPLSRRLKFYIQRQVTKLSGHKADHVFFVSDFSKETSNKYLSLPESKISTVYHGLEPTLFKNPSPLTDEKLQEVVKQKSPYILTVSTVVEHKNYEVLLKAYARLPSEIKENFPLVIAGRMPSEGYMQTLQKIQSNHGIEQRVFFLGGVDYENIPYLYSKAAVYVLPSKLETFGHTLIEAMASGVPVIAADSTCIPEITGGAAELFDPKDDRKLANLIKELLMDESKQEALTEAGYKRSEDFSWDKTFQQTKELLHKVAET